MTDQREQRRLQRRREIQEQACRLTAERGFDGFTMDDLASAVGVSRRTLFNYVPDKATAVIGEGMTEVVRDRFDAFVAGGPSGRLMADLVSLVREAVRDAEVECPDAAGRFLVVERAVACDPKVALMMKSQSEQALRGVAAAVCAREGWVEGDLRATVLAARVLSLIALMLDEVVRRRGAGAFSDVLDELLAADAELFGSAAVTGLPA